MTRSVVIAVWVGLAGCGHPPDCTKTVAKAADAMDIHATADVKALTEMCEKGWSATQRQCIADAKDIGHVAGCAPDLVTYEMMKSREAELAAERAAELAAQAAAAATQAQAELEKIQTDLTALNDELTAAIDAVAKAQNDHDRSAAKVKLAELQHEQAAMQARMAAASSAAARAQRAKGVTISKECMDNPLAKGCQ
jgi:chromosome segregation ATPase